MSQLYTIGYCRFSPEELLTLANRHQIKAIIDVRAVPFSRAFPQYNTHAIKRFLNDNEIYYLSFAEEFGGRIMPPNDGMAPAERYEFLKNSESFKAGLDRLEEGLKKFNVCLMCAQKDPIICHRSILIAHNYQVTHPEAQIFHIKPEGMETQTELDSRVLKKHRAKLNPLLSASPAEQLEEACRLQFANTCA